MLKWLALIFMTIDHIGYSFKAFLPETVYLLMRAVGRLAFPIFAFYIVKGFTRTSNRGKYLLRMVFWAIVSHFTITAARFYVDGGTYQPFTNLAWTNVLILFSFALVMLLGYDLAMRSYRDMIASMTLVCNTPIKLRDTRFDVRVNLGGISLPPRVGVPVGIFMMLAAFWFADLLNSDYEIYGLLYVLLIYISYCPEDDKVTLSILTPSLLLLNGAYIVMSAINHESLFSPVLQTLSVFSIFLFNIFPKQKTKPGFFQKNFFYIYYPLHFSLLLILADRYIV